MAALGKARSLGLLLAFTQTAPAVWAQAVLDSGFGGGGQEAVAFVVAGGREVVTLGLAGRPLEQARLFGAAKPVRAGVVDPVSRLVVFRSQGTLGEGLPMAAVAPVSGVLKEAGEGRSFRIGKRVKQVEGRYLPFTVLRLAGAGKPPKPGAPLFDAGGRVAAVAHQAVGEGAFYALPVEIVHRVLEDSRDGRISRAWIGIVLNPGRGGARVERVVPDSPADESGVRGGDVLREVGGRRVEDYGDAVNAFYLLRPERPVRLKVRRGAGEVMLELTPGVSGAAEG